MSSSPTSDAAALSRAAAGIGVDLPAAHAAALVAYVDAMLDENTRVNLTAIRDRESALLLHALDALGLQRLDHDPSRTLDLGTGNGFPGIAVAVCAADADVTLLDRTQKKLKAIGRAIERAGLARDRLTCRHADAAQLPALQAERYSLITCRAVGAPEAIAKLAAPLLARGGRLALWLAEGTDAPDALTPRLRRQDVVEYDLPAPASRSRRIATYG